MDRIHGRLADLQREFEIAPANAESPLSWTVRAIILYCKDIIADLGPHRLRGYGPLDEQTSHRLRTALTDLDEIVTRLGSYLEPGEDSEAGRGS